LLNDALRLVPLHGSASPADTDHDSSSAFPQLSRRLLRT
jgi:hypothetical protein